MNVKSIVFFGGVVLTAAALLYGQVDPVGVRVGERAPDFTVQDAGAHELHLSDLRGNLVFLNFWATWCPPCVQEAPDVELIHRAFKDRKFRMVAISADYDVKTVTEFYDRLKLTSPAYLDPKRRISERYGVFAFPETFIIDESGYVLKHYVGARSWTNPDEMRALDGMIRAVEEQ